MELKRKQLVSILICAGLLTVTSVVLTGCKKSEPGTTEPAATEMSKEMTQQEGMMAETATQVAAATEQTMCPIMDGNKIDKNVFVEYKGKKVYFCCPDCKAKFNADPEKYIAKLPQFKQ
jgi:YHS domain-containing protein